MPKEQSSSLDYIHPNIIERHELPNGYLLFLTDLCPAITRAMILDFATNRMNEMPNFFRSIEDVKSRRRVATPIVPSRYEMPIFKKKILYQIDETDPDIGRRNNARFYTTMSQFHELRMALVLQEILQKVTLPQSVTSEHGTLDIAVRVQQPWGMLQDMNDPDEGYSIFQYLHGHSIRNDVKLEGGWFNVPPEKMKLYSRVIVYLQQVTKLIVEAGLDPHDLGIHQILHGDVKEADGKESVLLSIIDTEQFTLTRWRGGPRIPYNELEIAFKFLMETLFA